VTESDAVCFDFYNTLATNLNGRGRGSRVMEYLEQHGLESDPWTHQVLYDIFEPHLREYSPNLPPAAKAAYYCRLAERLFSRLNVRAPTSSAAMHASALWSMLGPSAFAVFPEAPAVLRTIKMAGLGTAVVSNWMCGLSHFCVELGLHTGLDHVISSADFGVAKPDPAIFLEACRRLGTSPARTLHVGDTTLDDLEGAQGAGLRAILLDRSDSTERAPGAISNLYGLLEVVGFADWTEATNPAPSQVTTGNSEARHN
jgi:putative hydrolase of the HAD superfamily